MQQSNIDLRAKTTETSVSRRAFLASAAAVGTATLINNTEASASTDDTAPAASSTDLRGKCEVYEADLLVIGSGLAGTQVALEAYEKGARSIMIVDKGPFQFSGGGGMNWDVMMGWGPADDKYETSTQLPMGAYVLSNHKAGRAAFEGRKDQFVGYVEHGGLGYRRDKNGDLYYIVNAPTYKVTDNGFMRNSTDVLRGYDIAVYDQTLLTDFLVINGECRGAMGIHMPTGTFRIFRSKATVKCTGATCWFYGWSGTSAYSINVPDNTGELDTAAMRHGCGVTGSEFWQFDLIQVSPKSICCSFNAGIGADRGEWAHVSNSDGEYFMADITYEEMYSQPRSYFGEMCARQVAAGKGGPNGGVFVDMSGEAIEKLRPVYKRNVELWQRVLGIDATASKLEVGLEVYERSGNAMVDENLMTELPGLFDTRGGGLQGESGGGGGNAHSWCYGPYAAKKAMEYIDALGESEGAFDWEPVITEFNRLQELLNREDANGIRPHVVRHAIQNACFAALGPVREGEKLQACVDELARIRKEDMPRQVVTNKTLVFNNEWKEALENYGLLDAAEAAARAALMREETRGGHARLDFAEKDDYWGSVHIVARLADGEIAMETVAIDA